MKRIGLGLLIFGLIITVYTGFNFITREKVLSIGELEITSDKNHFITWSPLLGVAVIILGAVLFLADKRKQSA